MTPAQDATTLLPCPFCGATAHVADTGNMWACCNGCDAEGPVADNEAEAIRLWNIRAVPQTPDAVREALQKIVGMAAKRLSDHTECHCTVCEMRDQAEIALHALSTPSASAGPQAEAVIEQCDSCKFYRLGECHLNPPSRLPRKFDAQATAGNRVRDEELIWGWPLTGPKNWCGYYLAHPQPQHADGRGVSVTRPECK